jgi:integrase/recombinase XerD
MISNSPVDIPLKNVYSSEESKKENLAKCSDLLAAYFADQRLRGHAYHTIRAKGIRTRTWLAWCEGRQLDPSQAGREDFLAYLLACRERCLKTATLRKIFSNLVSFYEFLEEAGKSRSAGEVKNIQKKYLHAYKSDGETRQIISVRQAAEMVAATFSTRDRAILLLLLKTGIRRSELVSLDLLDVDMQTMNIRLKSTGKRTNKLVFFDHEAQDGLRRWLTIRKDAGPALFLSSRGQRISGDAVRYLVVGAAKRAGLHTPDAPLEQRFGAHCCRHWWTTHLLRSGMQREYVQWLRGDAIKEAVDIYYHISPDDVKRSYLAHIPQLGV